jgi:FAD-linked sulfhydryl oxidase
MMRISGPRARFVVLALVVCALCSFILVGPYKVTPAHLASTSTSTEKKLGRTSEAVLTGHAIAPKLENATAK